MNDLSICRWDGQPVDVVARIHQEVIPYSLSSMRGIRTLKSLYLRVPGPDDIFLVVKGPAGPIGALLALKCPLSTLRSLRQGVLPLASWLRALRAFGPLELRREIEEAFLLAREFSNRHGGFHIASLVVSAEYHGCGIGTALLDELLRLTRGDNAYVSVDTRASNNYARNFYVARGFKEIKTIKRSVVLANFHQNE